MEAVFGAIYRDSGYEIVFQRVEEIFGDRLYEVTPSDPKTELQEILHMEGSEAPTYQIELVEGPVHAPTFIAVVIVDGQIAGRGKGPTKKAAHQSAAEEVLMKLAPSIQSVKLKEGQTAIIESALLIQTKQEELNDKSKPITAKKRISLCSVDMFR